MYLILIKENGKHTLSGIAENISDIKDMINNNKLKEMINIGKAYLVEGSIKIIRPETTPELLEIEEKRKETDKYY